MKSKKFLSAAAILTMLLGAHSALSVPVGTSQLKPGVNTQVKREGTTGEPESQESVTMDPEDCVATIDNSTRTERGQSFTATFTTTKTTYSVGTGLAFSIEDPDFVTDDEIETTASVKFTVDPVLKDVKLEFGLFESLDKIANAEPIASTLDLEVGKFLAIKVKKGQELLTKEDVSLVVSASELQFDETTKQFYIELAKAGTYNVSVTPKDLSVDETKGVAKFNIDPSFGKLNFEFNQFDSEETKDVQTPVEDITALEVGKFLAIKVTNEGDETPLTNKDIYLMDGKGKGTVRFDATYDAELGQFYIEIKRPSKSGIYNIKVVPVYDGLLDSFPATNIIHNRQIYIPTTAKYGTQFGLNIYGVKEGAIDFGVKNIGEKIDRVFIPASVTELAENAIVNASAFPKLEIICEVDEAPSTWSTNWTDAKPDQIKFANDTFKYDTGKKDSEGKPILEPIKVSDYFATKVSEKDLNQGISGTSGVAGSKTFYIGTDEVPLLFKYKIKKNGVLVDEEQTFEVGAQASNTTYDAVGKDLGRPTVTKNIDVPLESDEEIVPTSIRFEGIYEAKKKDSGVGFELDTSKEYKMTPKFNGKVVDLKQIVSFNFDRLSTFKGFTSLEMTAEIAKDENGNTVYPELMHYMYEKNKSKINAGQYKIRFRVTGVQQTNVKVVYEVGEGEEAHLVTDYIPLKSVKPAFELDANEPTRVVFLMENTEFSDPNFDMSRIKEVYLESLTIQTDIVNLDTGKLISKSDFRARFGSTQVYNSEVDEIAYKNVNIDMVLTVVIFTLIYIAISVAYFFYKKKAFKNDEFKRLNPKSFVKNALMGYLTLQIFILDVFVIFVRSTFMNNSTAIYNPLDAFIIVFSVLSLLLIGYFIRFYIIMAKAFVTKRKVDKLKLNDDSDDDGTK